jgi:uncharacterized protein YidB (DUF937 family)
MKSKKSIWIIGLLVALLVVGIVGATSAYAQGSLAGIFHGRGPGNNGRGLGPTDLAAAANALGMTTDNLSTALKSGQTLQQIATSKGVNFQTVMQAIQAARPQMLNPTELTAAANVLGMTTTDLSTALKNGQTLQQIATSKGVDIQKVKDAITTARRDALRTQINQAVTAGKLSQDKANWLLEGLDKGFFDGPGFGFGIGFGVPYAGHGFGNVPLGQPTQQTNP